jgi:hypothetical protein
VETSIEFNVKPDWDEIEKIRYKSAGFLQAHNFTDDSIDSLSMIISELVENGIKYGNFKRTENRVAVMMNIERNAVTIEVLNPVGDNAVKHLLRLDKTIQWIRGYQDPFEPYIERLKEVSKQPLEDAESGLGLVRIAYEGKALLDFFVGENYSLTVSAVTAIEGDDRNYS